ncbi:MAG: hypothetical protein A2017_21640 [Lentisphaerae bacterium GWF2_44_16]|nr:MAG: hypothetical protein A2017_21640 [Lentisphaerae bacterium GWF2_44_16]
MPDFLHALSNPDIAFLRYALIAGLMASIPFGIIGSYVVTRRISYIAGAISHSVLGGIGLAIYLKTALHISWCDPMCGALAAALASALLIGFVSMYAKQREDTVIGAIWSVGMASGILFIAKSPGYIDAMSYLFGNILLITRNDLFVIGGLNILILLICILFHDKFLAICFDEEFAILRGINVKFYYLLLLCLTALTIVLLVRIVGIVMVIAFLTLPAAVGGHFSRRLSFMMFISAAICMSFTFFGLWASYSWDLPSGSTIIVFAGLCYILTAIASQFLKRRKKRIS